jgi:hypothetical protein
VTRLLAAADAQPDRPEVALPPAPSEEPAAQRKTGAVWVPEGFANSPPAGPGVFSPTGIVLGPRRRAARSLLVTRPAAIAVTAVLAVALLATGLLVFRGDGPPGRPTKADQRVTGHSNAADQSGRVGRKAPRARATTVHRRTAARRN